MEKAKSKQTKYNGYGVLALYIQFQRKAKAKKLKLP